MPVPGADLDGVYYLRTLADCDVLRERLDAGGRVVVVGAGWIGSEFAASARQRGLEVTVVDPPTLPNERIFGAEIGAFYRDVHAQHGVELLLGEGVESFEGDGAVARCAPSGRQDRVRLRRRRHRRRAARRAGPRRRPGGRQRHRRRREAADLRAETSSRPATSRTPGIRSTSGGSASSTGPTRSTRGRRRRARCSASRSATTASRTSSPTSTTSGWSTPATHRVG